MRQLSGPQARRIALAAQGFTDPPPSGRVDIRHLRRVLQRIALLQIDSVNVLVRSHYLPLFSRLGAYPRPLLPDAAYRRRELFECWAHEASYLPTPLQPLLRHRMADWRPSSRVRRLLTEDPGYVDKVRAEIAEHGPLSAGELGDPGQRAGPWWGWPKGKVALEWLFGTGEIAVARRRNFTRLYDLTERVLPPRVLAAPTPEPTAAKRTLLQLGARAHGVGTAADIADYFRLHVPTARTLLTQMAAEGQLEQVAVEGWREPAYLHPEAVLPRTVDAAALLSPFDPVVWHRPRAERLFGFVYRIEIYVPAFRRVYGYYVCPFLLGDRLVARVDLKADRQTARLLVRGAWSEPGAERSVVGPALRDRLTAMARWLELDAFVVERGARGDLVGGLGQARLRGGGTPG